MSNEKSPTKVPLEKKLSVAARRLKREDAEQAALEQVRFEAERKRQRTAFLRQLRLDRDADA